MLLSRERNSTSGRGGTSDGGEEAGIGKPTTGKAGGEGSEVEPAPAPQDVVDMLCVSDAGADENGDAGAGTGLATADEDLPTSGVARGTAISCWMLFSME